MHAESGARFLEKHGYTAVSDIVKHHMTSDGLSADMNEHTIVFLADKLLRETELVTPKERYAPAFSKFPKGTETGDRIRKDCAFAEQLLKLYTDLTGDKI